MEIDLTVAASMPVPSNIEVLLAIFAHTAHIFLVHENDKVAFRGSEGREGAKEKEERRKWQVTRFTFTSIWW